MKSISTSNQAAFSLTEVSLSIAIIAAVLLPMLALLAGGSGIVAKSEDRFAASGVAGGIVSQLRFSPDRSGFVLFSDTGGVEAPPEETVIPLPSSGGKSEVFLGFDRYGRLKRSLEEGVYLSGTEGAAGDEVFYLTKVLVEEESGQSKGSTPQQSMGAPPLYRVTLSVESPAFTTMENRSAETLTTILAGR